MRCRTAAAYQDGHAKNYAAARKALDKLEGLLKTVPNDAALRVAAREENVVKSTVAYFGTGDG